MWSSNISSHKKKYCQVLKNRKGGNEGDGSGVNAKDVRRRPNRKPDLRNVKPIAWKRLKIFQHLKNRNLVV